MCISKGSDLLDDFEEILFPAADEDRYPSVFSRLRIAECAITTSGSRITSDGGLIPVREVDERFCFGDLMPGT